MSSACDNLIDPKVVRLSEILDEHKNQKGALIPVLQKAQEIYGYLPASVLQTVSKTLRIPIAKVYGVVTFYSQFRLKPVGRNMISICLGTACHVRGGAKVLDTIESHLGIKDGGTTEDERFSFEIVACMGACGLAPVIAVNGQVYGRLTPEMIPEVLSKYE
ncbi:MAG: NADH-quinone oxidoreductase subunit NuoE [Desulfitobacterium hafniense]|nr:NADH-quinone oxidoreductase subunit NuoE [Desulfitobacterium hafniense]